MTLRHPFATLAFSQITKSILFKHKARFFMSYCDAVRCGRRPLGTRMTDQQTHRRVFCVLSARALPYARHALSTLFTHSSESLCVTLITDAELDKQHISSAISLIETAGKHEWSVHSQAEADDRASTLFARHPNLQNFRGGHPCWRKLTDPILFSEAGAEMIILDPDLYFPNYFSFERTPDEGLLLMRQPPSCLLPHEVVMSAYDASIKLAHHVDIGVAQMRSNVDLDWLDWLIAKLGGRTMPRAMHVEAIVWAALAMRVGGGYLDPERWHCWRYRQWKRLALRLGVRGINLLKLEKLEPVKCFHASGVAKWWIEEACRQKLFHAPKSVIAPSLPLPFEEFTFAAYQADQRLKHLVRKLGYYNIMATGA